MEQTIPSELIIASVWKRMIAFAIDISIIVVLIVFGWKSVFEAFRQMDFGTDSIDWLSDGVFYKKETGIARFSGGNFRVEN